MRDFLQLTLSGARPAQTEGHNERLSWRWHNVGILELTPHHTASMALVVSSALHGNETAPVEMVEQLVNALLRGERALQTRLLVIYGNPGALRLNRRYVHSDINRMFGGRWQQFEDCPEARRAWVLEQAMENFWQAGVCEEMRWHLDIHTAIRDSYHHRFGVLPQRDTPWPEDFIYWLSAAGLEALVQHRAPGGTFSDYSSRHFQAASCTLELGKALPFGHNDLSQFAAAQQALKQLISGGELPAAVRPPRRYRVSQQIIRRSDRFVLHMSDEVLNFAPYPQGTLLAEDGAERFCVQQAQEYVLFPNPNVAIGLRAGLMLVEDNTPGTACRTAL
ncbi:succinylglutamate desuccinylase [Erwinia pyrifoliae]|uniref:succinylglutamate desuccinylase n=1 Tax=Erwinia pyrifoliae TaxID=79967 RepID=UPI0001960BAB|nr:succinylglutamate desuccinylase [Erwinia pyrifoliae]AUX72579.1 succinylglutamate desuccinylase [Erwinia pyrifoliae]MCA8877164.1 succinylglutamate desuccinylase [Erwinia pyrifoliae]MCU8587054.1 succinylglutamate desuccinylase [Erwinia pyrifoliae]UWS30920.1 succinylglutamate desuccinylase [Erwinia pyrifoliae]CAX55722.1 Succinylglutamate desuccinylase [Erwinia pyrifoliae Ep1/96]